MTVDEFILLLRNTEPPVAESELEAFEADIGTQLPEDYRQAILLMKIEGLSTVEAAGRLGRTRDATALLLHRAIKRFRAQAGPE